MREVMFTIAVCFTVVLVSEVSADSPDGKAKFRPLTGKDLSGTWRGEKNGIKVQITFGGTEDARLHMRLPKAGIDADLKRVDDKKSGTVHLRLDYVETATGKKGSAVRGHLERDESGTLRLTILPAATKITSADDVPGFEPVERVQLTEFKDKKP